MLSLKTLSALLFSIRWDIVPTFHFYSSFFISSFIASYPISCPSDTHVRTFAFLSHSLRLLFSFLHPHAAILLLTQQYSLLHSAISEPIPDPLTKIYRRASPTPTTCPDITTTFFIPEPSFAFQTLSFVTPAPCVSIETVFDGPCTRQVLESGCFEVQCIDSTTFTVGCPGGCCPTSVSTSTTTVSCTRKCGRTPTAPGGCPVTATSTATVGC